MHVERLFVGAEYQAAMRGQCSIVVLPRVPGTAGAARLLLAAYLSHRARECAFCFHMIGRGMPVSCCCAVKAYRHASFVTWLKAVIWQRVTTF